MEQNPNFADDNYEYKGRHELACIYQSFEEREANRPRRKAVPNP